MLLIINTDFYACDLRLYNLKVKSLQYELQGVPYINIISIDNLFCNNICLRHSVVSRQDSKLIKDFVETPLFPRKL